MLVGKAPEPASTPAPAKAASASANKGSSDSKAGSKSSGADALPTSVDQVCPLADLWHTAGRAEAPHAYPACTQASGFTVRAVSRRGNELRAVRKIRELPIYCTSGRHRRKEGVYEPVVLAHMLCCPLLDGTSLRTVCCSAVVRACGPIQRKRIGSQSVRRLSCGSGGGSSDTVCRHERRFTSCRPTLCPISSRPNVPCTHTHRHCTAPIWHSHALLRHRFSVGFRSEGIRRLLPQPS
jgi:hypothetical protein